jgi:ADP-ribose pyrophosphatase YjhB (NUDIX family)
MNLSPATTHLVRQAIRKALAPYAGEELTGVSCLARGADSIFAETVLDLGGRLEVVLPTRTYREQKVKPDHAPLFDELVRRATTVHTLPFEVAGRDAYEAANEVLLSSSDRLVAVWDGQTGVDKGSTASVVAAARERGLPVEVVWPDGATRDQRPASVYPARVTGLTPPPMARPFVSAGALFTDAAGRILMVRPTYKGYWDIPGGYVEPGESPRAACAREIREELGLSVEIGPLLVVDWAPAEGEGDKILYVFAAEPLTDEKLATVTFTDGEIAEARFVDLPDIDALTIPRLTRRLRTALEAWHAGRTIYAEHGEEPA